MRCTCFVRSCNQIASFSCSLVLAFIAYLGPSLNSWMSAQLYQLKSFDIWAGTIWTCSIILLSNPSSLFPGTLSKALEQIWIRQKPETLLENDPEKNCHLPCFVSALVDVAPETNLLKVVGSVSLYQIVSSTLGWRVRHVDTINSIKLPNIAWHQIENIRCTKWYIASNTWVFLSRLKQRCPL